jgi:hypothetical protein
MHTYIEFGLILSSLCFWFYIDSVKLFEEKVINSGLIHGIICGVGINVGYIYIILQLYIIMWCLLNCMTYLQ